MTTIYTTIIFLLFYKINIIVEKNSRKTTTKNRERSITEKFPVNIYYSMEISPSLPGLNTPV